jgi:hypothetical protein
MKTRKPNKGPMVDVCELLWKQIDKPANLDMCRAINVYDNRYRINVYTRKYDMAYDIERVRITQSYFAQLNDDELVIKA